MQNKLMTENYRKNQLFEFWNEHLDQIHSHFNGDEVDEIFEGMATVAKVAENSLTLLLEDRRKIQPVLINAEIARFSVKADMIFMAMARVDSKWFPIDVVSIGSLFGCRQKQAHMTLNPRLMEKLPQLLVDKLRAANEII